MIVNRGIGRQPWTGLVVEDEFFIAFDLEERLVELGAAEVRCARDAEDAARLTDAWTPSVAIVDWRLGGVTPVKLIEQLLARGVSVAVASGSHKSEIEPRFADRVVYLQKPVPDEALAGAVHALLASRD